MARRHADVYFVPAYLGQRGWAGFRLDSATVDGGELRELLVEIMASSARSLG